MKLILIIGMYLIGSMSFAGNEAITYNKKSVTLSFQAKGKVNGKNFTVVDAAIFKDPFDEGKAEILLSEKKIEDCFSFSDMNIILPLQDINNIFTTHVIKPHDTVFARFYDYDGGRNVNASINKKKGMTWSLTQSGEQIVGEVSIANDSGNDKYYVNGSFIAKDCLDF